MCQSKVLRPSLRAPAAPAGMFVATEIARANAVAVFPVEPVNRFQADADAIGSVMADAYAALFGSLNGSHVSAGAGHLRLADRGFPCFRSRFEPISADVLR